LSNIISHFFVKKILKMFEICLQRKKNYKHFFRCRDEVMAI
jgi:hypothetical protein